MYSIPQRVGDEQAKFDELERKIFATLHCADIGTITAIDSSTSYLTVRPTVKERVVNSSGKTEYKELPEIPDTPYLAISGATPSVGQSVLIIYCDRDFSGWLKQGGTNASGTVTAQNPEILSYHSLNHAVALVGFGANTNIVPSTSYGNITSSTSATEIGVSQALVDVIKSYEGFVNHPYQDSGGTWTIGYGHTFTPPWTGSNPMTETEGETLLKQDIAPRVSSVNSIMSGFSLTQNQKDALVDFVYNLGAGNLQGSDLERDIRNHASSDKLKVDFEEYSHVGGKVLAGLVHRRDAEWAMFCNGKYLGNG